MSMAGYKLDNTFMINHMSFGKKEDFESIAERFPDAGVMHPLDGFGVVKPVD